MKLNPYGDISNKFTKKRNGLNKMKIEDFISEFIFRRTVVKVERKNHSKKDSTYY